MPTRGCRGRDWAAHGDRLSSRDERRKSFQKWTAVRCLVRLGTETAFQWRKGATTRNQQTRRYLPANFADPRCALGGKSRQSEDRSAQRLDHRQATPVRNIESLRGRRQQERSDRVGADCARRIVPARSVGIKTGKRFL